MLAYAHRYACPRILLLYPQTADMPALLQKIFTLDATTTITAATINLTQNLTTSSGRLALIKELKHLLNTLTPSPV
jgi:5-methylcytosine-specific restriction endonuclease McrBC regulatory subunit McrC